MNAIEKLAASAARFVDGNTFGTTADYCQDESEAVAIRVAFQDSFSRGDPLGMEFTNSGPAALARTVDCPDAGPKDVLIVVGNTYRVTEAQKGAAGLTTLFLSTDRLPGPAPASAPVISSESDQGIATEGNQLLNAA